MSDTTTGIPAPPPPPRRAPTGRIVLVVVGALLVLLGLVLGGVGAVLTWAHPTQRDADGYFTSDRARFETLGYAITSEEVDLGVRPGAADRRFDLGDLATVRITVRPDTETPVFVGIGPEDEVARYLDGVAHAVIDDVDFDPFQVTYRVEDGDEPRAAPDDEDFWVASASGSQAQTLEWELESGRWSVVLMNADGSPGVGATASIGVKAGWVLGVGVGLLVAGGVLLIGGAVLLAVGAVGLARRTEAETPTQPGLGLPAAAPGHPVRLEGRFDLPLNRWLWLVKWLLLIPHIVVLAVLWTAFVVLTVIAGFAILFTGRYPRPLFDFNVGVLRWTWRVGFYSFAAFATDRYPPFTLGAVEDYPATLDIAYPARLSRGLVLVKWWLLAIPHYVVVGIIGGGLVAWGREDGDGGPGLVIWLVLVAMVALLFVGRYPRGIFDFVMGLNRWAFRVIPYAALMTDDYPPFRLDQGGPEPDAPRTPA